MDAPEGRPLSRQQALDEVRGALAQLRLGPADVDLEVRLVDDLDLDSLDWVELAVQLEERLDIALREQKFASVRTVGDVVDRVQVASTRRGTP